VKAANAEETGRANAGEAASGVGQAEQAAGLHGRRHGLVAILIHIKLPY
jgi:hypothetical protein